MATFTVLQAKSIQDLVQHVLDYHKAPTTLVICSSKDSFCDAFQSELEKGNYTDTGRKHFSTTPTLRLLSTSRTVKLAFCPDITHLRAYLAIYSTALSNRELEPTTALRLRGATPILAVLNPIQLHRSTSAFSAQGLNRTFAVAVEAAHTTGSKLILAECLTASEPTSDQMSGENNQQAWDPWDEELSILNLTTKRLGDMSVGRTIKARAVAERWCTFQRLPDFTEL